MKNLFNFFENTAEKNPDKVAVYFEDKPYTYESIYHNSLRVAAGLQALGVTKADRVIVCLGNCIESIYLFWGCLRIGACVSNITNELSSKQVEYIVEDSQAALLVCENSMSEQLSVTTNICVLTSPESNSLRLENAKTITLDDLLKHTELCLPYPISVDLASIIYTSGSTGEPKGVMMTHLNMLAATESISSYLDIRSDDTILCVLPMSFDYGMYQMIMTFYVGASLVLERGVSWPGLVFQKTKNYGCTILPGIPTLFTMLGSLSHIVQSKFNSIRTVTNTGASLTAKHIEIVRDLFPEAQIFSMFGLTECKRCTYLPPSKLDQKPNSVGIAIPDTEILVVDADNKPCPAYVSGELIVRGATVMQGYWRKPEETARKLRPHPNYGETCLYTGDHGYLDEDGYFYFSGRIDEVLKIRGQKVLPIDVETTLYDFPQVTEAAVIFQKNSASEASLVAYVAGNLQDEDQALVLKHCRDRLHRAQVPERIIIRDSLPKNTNGKIDKVKLRAEAQVQECTL